MYLTTNLVNGKRYIGKHKTDTLNDGYIGSGKALKRAIKKHGRANFRREILFDFDNPKEMDDKEVELITDDVLASVMFYNMIPGQTDTVRNSERMSGERNPMYGRRSAMKGRRHSEETKELMRARRIGHRHTEESKTKMSKSSSGVNHPFYGKKFSVEHRQRISEGQMGRGTTEKQRETTRLVHSKNYVVTKPDGQCISVFNLKAFCDLEGLSYHCMVRVAAGKLKQHRKHKCEKINEFS